jgi:hypothetical protein
LILDLLVAKNFKEIQGFHTKEQYSQWLSENVKIPAGQYWGADLIYAFMLPFLAPYNDPKSINIVVVGGETNAFWKTTDFAYSVSASI